MQCQWSETNPLKGKIMLFNIGSLEFNINQVYLSRTQKLLETDKAVRLAFLPGREWVYS